MTSKNGSRAAIFQHTKAFHAVKQGVIFLMKQLSKILAINLRYKCWPLWPWNVVKITQFLCLWSRIHSLMILFILTILTRHALKQNSTTWQVSVTLNVGHDHLTVKQNAKYNYPGLTMCQDIKIWLHNLTFVTIIKLCQGHSTFSPIHSMW